MTDITNRLKNFRLPTETEIIDKLTAASPWMVQTSVVQMTATGLINHKIVSPPVAWVTGIAIEIMNVSIISVGMRIYKHNNDSRYKAKKNQVPMWIAYISYAFSLTVTLLLVVALEIPQGEITFYDWLLLGTRGLVALLSLPASMQTATRFYMGIIQESVEVEKKKRKEEKEEELESSRKVSESEESSRKVSEELENSRKYWRNFSLAEKLSIYEMGIEEASERFSYADPKTIKSWFVQSEKLHAENNGSTTKAAQN